LIRSHPRSNQTTLKRNVLGITCLARYVTTLASGFEPDANEATLEYVLTEPFRSVLELSAAFRLPINNLPKQDIRLLQISTTDVRRSEPWHL